MAESTEYHGSLVAFEGPSEHIQTQLRLLPTSPQIAILPSIQNYLDAQDPEDSFDARKFIQRVHNALETRNETAQSFLRGSTPANKRLVFMNGGTPSAQVLCIKAIAENETDGDFLRAEFAFNGLIKDGLAGLEKEPTRERHSFAYQQSEEDEDPITRAMRAADALDRQTAGLQPNNDIDLSLAPRPRSMSLPIYSFADRFGDAAPFYVFGAQDDDPHGDEQFTPDGLLDSSNPRVAITHFYGSEDGSESYFEYDDMYNVSDGQAIPPKSPSCVGEAYSLHEAQYPSSPHTKTILDLLSPRSDAFSIHSTEPVVYGEASLVEMKAPIRKKPTVKRVRSLDRMYLGNAQYRDTLLRLHSKSKMILGEEELPSDGRRYSCIEVADANNPLAYRTSYIEPPRTVHVRSSRSTITLSPPPLKPKRKLANPRYVDRGTDAEEIPEDDAPFRPVFPFTEDLVIHFRDDSLDPVLESILRAFKNGVYPVTAPSSNNSDVDDQADLPGTPRSQSLDLARNEETEGQSKMPTVATDSDDYDPFAYPQHTWNTDTQPLHIAQAMRAPAPPTPAQTPPPTLSESEAKFHDFNTVNCHTAVTMQNSLRSILNIYFPPKDQGYHQFHFPLLPELDGLWKPIFRESEPGSPRPDSSSRRIDQILAIGAQRGVKREYISTISGKLEKLGTKASGLSRSGRVDFRYLIANAMQAFTAQPLADQTHDNPFTNSYLLATLVIPHLETYFAAHSEVRFLLLEYPPDHLPTVLALQKLLGVDLMKVAKIVDSNTKEPLPFNHVRGASISRTPSEGTLSINSATPPMKPLPPTPTHQPESLSISKANFLLTSTATDAEITTFISTILKMLKETSQFYVSEDSPKVKATTPTKRVPTPLSGSFSPFPRINQGRQSPPLSPLSAGGARAFTRSASPATSMKTPSIAETVKTTKSNKSRRARSRKGEKAFGDAASTFTMDPAEYDSDYDVEERRLMPMFMRGPQARKGNSRKALKFLGLA